MAGAATTPSSPQLLASHSPWMRTSNSFEEAQLVVPHTRIRYPDPIARRFWLERHPGFSVRDSIEPDGPRWEAAVALTNALFRWENQRIYGPTTHPLDEPDLPFMEFLEQPSQTSFQPWLDMRVDVSNDVYPKVFDDGNVETYYTTWQLLLAAEVADAGVHFRINLAHEPARRSVREALDTGNWPADHAIRTGPSTYTMRGFIEHRSALDAIVWFVEETHRALTQIRKGETGRFQFNENQNALSSQAERQAAQASSQRFHASPEDIIKLCRFLSERWWDWNQDGRPLIADAYKEFLGQTVHMARILGDLSFADIRDRVGRKSGWLKPILDVIWPDWKEEEKDRARRTLMASIGKSENGDLDSEHINAFIEFLGQKNLDGFFWRLNSFENHAFRGNEFALDGMRGDLQGMAVAVEHVVRALGGTKVQLYDMFKELWHNTEVVTLLKCDGVSRLARTGKQDWPTLKREIESLRKQGAAESIAADLVMAYRIRGGAHHTIPEADQFELERLFVGLMRVAALTFAEVQRHGAVKV